MEKGLKLAGLTLGFLGVFAVGNITGANTDWKTSAINSANSSMGKAGYEKKEEIVNNADADIQAFVLDELSIEEREAELKRLLDEYYRLKLEGMTNTETFRLLETEISNIQNSILERYKKEIDSVFVGK